MGLQETFSIKHLIYKTIYMYNAYYIVLIVSSYVFYAIL